MGAKGQRLRLRCFIEGIEVPVIAAQVQTAPNSPAVCALQIPPVAEGTRLLPRSVLHVYFLDFYASVSPLITQRGASTTPSNEQNPTAYQQALNRQAQENTNTGEFSADNILMDTTNEQYKLLFAGEIIGFQWTKNAVSRSLVLQCQDFSNYWDYAFQWNNTDLFGPGLKALFSGGATNLFTDFLEDEGSVICRIIQSPSVQYPGLKGLLGGIVHLLEAIGGSYFTEKTFAGQNIFFSLAELRLHITQMITAHPDDPTAKNLLNAHGFGSLLGRSLGNLGQQVSIRKAINALMGHIFHETYAQPCPRYVPGLKGTISGFERKKVRDDPSNSFIATTADQLLVSIDLMRTDLSTTPSDNPTSQKQALVARAKNARTLCQQTGQKIRAKNIPTALSFYGAAQSAFGVAATKIQAKWRPGSTPTVISEITEQLDAAESQLKKAASLEINVTAKKKAVPARLNSQIFRPDVWFSAPPRCNVLFPENYHQLTYGRMFLQEPTRLLLKTNDEFFGEDELFDSFYFSPKPATSLKHTTGTSRQQRDVSLLDLLSNDLLDHELFTGILPVFEKMGELNIFAARSGTVNGKMPKVGLAQRSANFLYFKYRFAARQMQIEGRFNPYIACGFPGLIIDKYVDVATLSLFNELLEKTGHPTRDITKLLGTNFLGNFTEVSHVVDQQSGRTIVNCSYPRQPEESTEFLGVTNGNQVQRRFGQDALRSTDVAAIFPPKVGSLGPNFGQVASVTDVTDIYTAFGSDPSTALTLPLYTGPRKSGTGEPLANVPVGVAQPAQDYGPAVVDLAGDQFRPVTLRAFRVEEEVPRYRREVIDDPMEELIRPGWYGNIWHPSKIGQVYDLFFQTGAITDPQQIGDPAGASTGPTNQEAEDALATAAQARDANQPGDPRTDAPAIFTLDNNASIEQAVAFLVTTYSYIRSSDLDAEEFIRAYTWRPIASMVDMFGTSDLALSPDGQRVVSGVEGFHSRAFGPFEDLFGLVTPDIENIVGIKRGTTVAQRGDTRKRKQDAVKDLVAALQFSRAILG